MAHTIREVRTLYNNHMLLPKHGYTSTTLQSSTDDSSFDLDSKGRVP